MHLASANFPVVSLRVIWPPASGWVPSKCELMAACADEQGCVAPAPT